jgi:uncharacterized protein DUF4145
VVNCVLNKEEERMLSWRNCETITTKSYKCGHCGEPIASDKGYYTGANPLAYIYLCHNCNKPTYFDSEGRQTPGALYGGEVLDINDPSVSDLYNEARRCTGAGAYTSAVLSCRKLLMHIAVSKGAETGKKFIEYVQYLSDKNYIPPDAKNWVDHIRAKGNEANHEITIMREEDAKDLLSFIEMLLRIIYEFPANIRKKTATRTEA